MKWGIFVFVVLLPFWSKHPIHIAISEVVYDEKSRALQITHKIFIDDLEKQIEQSLEEAVKLRLNTAKEHENADYYLNAYLQKHFRIKVNGKEHKGLFLGKEYETDAAWLYVEIENIKSLKGITIENTILTDLYEDQNNFVHFNINKQKKSLRFQHGNTQQSINF